MRVYPKAMEIGENEGFTPEKDLFKKAEFGRSMSHLVGNIEDPLVIAFDGPWGSGKTTFLKMWAGELRNAGHPVIFFDAFENDYIEDAFAALAREIIILAESKIPKTDKIACSLKEKTANLGIALLKGSLKVASKAVVRAATAGIVDTSDFKEIAEDTEKETDDLAKHYIDNLLNEPYKQKELSSQFRSTLAELPSILAPPTEKESQKSLIFIIDELDRCKPLFALSLLERIKHFMMVQNIHFVLGVHMEQLCGSVRSAYGSEIDARLYLQKFIHVTIFNETRRNDTATELNLYANYLSRYLDLRSDLGGPARDAIKTIIRITRLEQNSYRTIERAFSILALSLGLTPRNHLQLGFLIGGLIMMKLMRPSIFAKTKQGTLTFIEAQDFLRFEPKANTLAEMSWEEKLWAFALEPNLPSEFLRMFNDLVFRYNMSSGMDILKYTANDIVDRIAPD